MAEPFRWALAPLGAALEFHGSGATPRGGKDSYKTEGVPLVRSMNVHDLRFEPKDLAFINGAQASQLTRVTVQPGDVLLNITGASVARCCLAPSSMVGGRVNQHVMILRFDPVRADPRWVGRALAGPYKQKLLAIAGSGATREALTRSDVASFEVSLPPLDVQTRVADTLQAFDDLIENNRRRIEILEEMARLLYREWFVHFRFPGHEDVGLVDSELGPIPDGWEVMRVEEVQAETRNATASGPFGSKLGRKDYVAVGVPVIRGTNLAVGGGFNDAGFVYVTADKAATLKSSLARPGDVLVTQRGTLGQTGLIPSDARFADYVISQSQMKLTCHTARLDPLIAYMQLASPEGVEAILSMATGSGVPHINLGMFREMTLLVPDRDVQTRLVAMAQPMSELERNLTQQNRVLREARDLLLPRLVSGELDVSELDLEGILS